MPFPTRKFSAEKTPYLSSVRRFPLAWLREYCWFGTSGACCSCQRAARSRPRGGLLPRKKGAAMTRSWHGVYYIWQHYEKTDCTKAQGAKEGSHYLSRHMGSERLTQKCMVQYQRNTSNTYMELESDLSRLYDRTWGPERPRMEHRPVCCADSPVRPSSPLSTLHSPLGEQA
jgi:hypothetical protein